jgi:hypothetical protein
MDKGIGAEIWFWGASGLDESIDSRFCEQSVWKGEVGTVVLDKSCCSIVVAALQALQQINQMGYSTSNVSEKSNVDPFQSLMTSAFLDLTSCYHCNQMYA